MTIKKKPYFYNAEFKRMFVQVMAAFSGYQVITGNQRDGQRRVLDTPIIYGNMQRVVGYILQGGSENTVPYLPVMSCVMTSTKQYSELRQFPQHFERFNFVERARDPDGKLLLNQAGKKKTVERMMAVPYLVNFDISIWASNQDQGFQLLEQILTVWNPENDILLSNSPADWTYLTWMKFLGDVTPESVEIEGGNVDPMFRWTLPFEAVLWLNPPVRVLDSKFIFEIVVPILELSDEGVVEKTGEVLFDCLQELDGLVIRADEDDVIFFESLGGV
jgi:hypothetical protein